MERVFVTRSLPGTALDELRQTGYRVEVWTEFLAPPREVLLERVRGAAGLITMLEDRVDAELMDAAGPDLKVIAQYAVGLDNVDLAAARERGIVVTHTPGVLTDATADLAFALLAAAARRVVEGHDYVRRGEWKTWHPELLLGPELHGATVGVVGFGRIGQAFARRARGFEMKVLYASRRPKPEAEAALAAERVELDELLARADFVSLHTPLTPETHRLMNAERLARMKEGAVLVNTARGKVVDTEALLDALEHGPLFAAGLDVTDPEPLPADHPLLGHPRVVVTPHIGSAGLRTRRRMAEMVAHDLRAVLEGRTPKHAAVLP
ncbi:2-hydroxyacid dehydrogenase [Deinococcota bacterium DY0809b]